MPDTEDGKAWRIARKYEDLIRDGVLTLDDRLPSIRAIAQEEDAAPETVVKALGSIAHLVTPRRGVGYFVTGRIEPTPQSRLEAVKAGGPLHRRTERVTVTDAGLVVASGEWEYVAGHLGLPSGSGVIRRQSVFYDPDGTPAMLAVSWFRPELAGPVPELLTAEPIPFAGGEAALIASRTGRAITDSEDAYHSRALLDDGREARLLRLPERSPCLAGAYKWSGSEGAIEYGEFVLPPRRDIVYRRHFRD